MEPLGRFKGARASMKRPREVAHFSYDEEHRYRDDDSGICYYHPPSLPADLCEGFDEFNRYEDKEDPHLDSLLKAIISKEKATGENIQADFVTWRGMMTKVRCKPLSQLPISWRRSAD
jgi:RAT1-interacting protein